MLLGRHGDRGLNATARVFKCTFCISAEKNLFGKRQLFIVILSFLLVVCSGLLVAFFRLNFCRRFSLVFFNQNIIITA